MSDLRERLGRVFEAAVACDCRPRWRAGREAFDFRCPTHDDRNPSAAAYIGERAVILACYAGHGCTFAGMRDALGLAACDLGEPGANGDGRRGATKGGANGERPREVQRWTYTDEDGAPLFDVVRMEPGLNGKGKTFRQHLPGRSSGGIGGVRRALYRLADVLAAVRDGWTIYICEGERCADAVNDHPAADYVFATTAPMGAGGWRDDYADSLAGAGRVLIWQDRDKPGERHARDVAASLERRGIPCEVVESPHEHDAADHLAAGRELRDVRRVDGGGVDPVDVFAVAASTPRYRVRGLVQHGGLAVTWAKRGGLKSYTELALVLHLLQREPRGSLFGHPGLEVVEGYRRVLWLACEESAERLRYRAGRLVAGMGLETPASGTLLHLPARGNGFTLTLDNLPQLAERHAPDCIVVDYLTGFRKRKDEDGRKIAHDLDNDEAHEATRPLRQLAAHGIDVRLIHHEGVAAGRARGATEYLNAADTELCLAVVPASGLTKAEVLKQKDAARPPAFLLDVDWSDGRTAIRYQGDQVAETLTPQEAAAVAYLEGVGYPGDPDQRTADAVAGTLGVDRSRASRILHAARAKGYADSEAGPRGRREWYVRGVLGGAHTGTGDDA